MIDGVKISTSVFDVEKLHQLINFTSPVNTDTGEIRYNKYGTFKKFASYNGLDFFIIENKNGNKHLIIKGSIHKYFNNGAQNYNTFSFNNIQYVLNDLQQKFNLQLDKCILSNLEIGVNIIPPLISLKILQGLLSHKTIPFKNKSMHNAEYYQVEHKKNFFIKIYDKALQYREKGYNIDHEILRIELKYVKMDFITKRLKKAGLIMNNYLTLNDLLNINILNNLGDLLLEKWKEIIFYDPTINVINPDHKLELQLSNWQNSLYWERLDKRKRYKEKIKLSKITDKYSQNIHTQIGKLIKDKLELLIPNWGLIDVSNDELNVKCLKDDEMKEKGLIDSIYKESIGHQEQKKVKCKIDKFLITTKNLKSNKLPMFDLSKFNDPVIPDYEEWINDIRP